MSVRRRLARGYTLMELVLVMTLSTICLGILAATVSRVTVANSVAQEHLTDTATIGRLGEQFRADVRGAKSVEFERSIDGSERLRLLGPDKGLIEYVKDDECIHRTQQVGEDTIARERFLLPGMTIVGWTVDEADRHEISLTLGWTISEPRRPAVYLRPVTRSEFSLRAPWNPQRSSQEAR